MEDKFQAKPVTQNGELNDDELDKVSGGTERSWTKNPSQFGNLDIKTFTADTLIRLGRFAIKADSITEDNS